MFRSFRSRFPVTAGLLLLAFLVACSDATGIRYSRLSLLLTDAPGDVKAAVVTIDRIVLVGGGEGDSLGLGDTGGHIVLREDDITVDLLTLADTVALIVDSALIPQGHYSEVRFVISGAYLEVEGADGVSSDFYASSPTYAALPEGVTLRGELQMPSYPSSGLKIKLPHGLADATVDELWGLIDFDVAESFGRAAGPGDRWVMHPVIRATPAAPPAAPVP